MSRPTVERYAYKVSRVRARYGKTYRDDDGNVMARSVEIVTPQAVVSVYADRMGGRSPAFTHYAVVKDGLEHELRYSGAFHTPTGMARVAGRWVRELWGQS